MPIDPFRQPLPLPEKRFVRDLDRGGCRGGIPIERQEAMASIRIEDSRERNGIQVHVGQLGEGKPSSGVTGPSAGPDEPQEDLGGGALLIRVERRVRLVGATGEDTAKATQLAVLGQGQAFRSPTLVELGQGVLEERQGARLVGGIGDQARNKGGLDTHPRPLCGADDGFFQLLHRHRQDVDHPRQEGASERREEQRAVVEVRAQRQDDGQLRAGIGHGVAQQVQEPLRQAFVIGGEELLELVDHREVPAGAARRDGREGLRSRPGRD